MTILRVSAAVAAMSLVVACASSPEGIEPAAATTDGDATTAGERPEPDRESVDGDQDDGAGQREMPHPEPDEAEEPVEDVAEVELEPGGQIESAGRITTHIEGVAVTFELPQTPDETIWGQTPSEDLPVLMMLFDGAAVLMFTVTEVFDDTDGEPVRDWAPDDLREVFDRTVSFDVDGPTDVDHDQFDDAFTASAVAVDGNPFEQVESLPAMLVAATEGEFTLTMAQQPGSRLNYWLAEVGGQWLAVVADDEVVEIGETVFASLRTQG